MAYVNPLQLLVSKIYSPFISTPAKSNLIKNDLKFLNHSRRLAEVVHQTCHSLTAGERLAFNKTVVALKALSYKLLFFWHSCGGTPQHWLIFAKIWLRPTMTLLTWSIWMKDYTASTRRLTACCGIVSSYPRVRGNMPTMPSATYWLIVGTQREM